MKARLEMREATPDPETRRNRKRDTLLNQAYCIESVLSVLY